MARRRFFVDRAGGEAGEGHAEIAGDDAHHLARVLRVEVGQKFEITDSLNVWLASVISVGKNLVRFSLDEELPRGPALPDVTLYLALIRFERFEWAVEKATELGVTRIVPLEAARSEHGLFQAAAKRAERWRRIAKEAGEQSRRLRAPDIGEAVRFPVGLQDTSPLRIWLDESVGAAPLLQVLTPLASPGACPVALTIGPEGGWTGPERAAFDESGWTGASLGPSVLRAETAVCAALAVFAQSVMIAGQ